MRVSPIIGRASGAKTYADFVAHITALATGGIVDWSGNGPTSGLYRTTASPTFSGTMWGSPWGTYFYRPTTPSRIIQHGLPTIEVLNDQTANGRQVLLQIESGYSTAYTSVARNGYTSASDSAAAASSRCLLILYWFAGQAWQINPFAQSTPTPYLW